jgi:hypothetical protein
MPVLANRDAVDDATAASNGQTGGGFREKRVSTVPDVNTGSRKQGFNSHVCRRLYLMQPYVDSMTSPTVDTDDDSRYRQHASADVAPELFEAGPIDR